MSRCVQTIFVARHAERLDCVDFTWLEKNAERDYDPPLTDLGKRQSAALGQHIKRLKPVSFPATVL